MFYPANHNDHFENLTFLPYSHEFPSLNLNPDMVYYEDLLILHLEAALLPWHFPLACLTHPFQFIIPDHINQ